MLAMTCFVPPSSAVSNSNLSLDLILRLGWMSHDCMHDIQVLCISTPHSIEKNRKPLRQTPFMSNTLIHLHTKSLDRRTF